MNMLLNHPETAVVAPLPLAGVSPWQREAATFSRTRILYVDDDDGLRGLGQKVLGRYGYDVDAVPNGWEALVALSKAHYSLLITDQNMPRLTGLELVVQARQAGIFLPVVMTSGNFSAKELPASLRTEIAAMLPKPFLATELLETVAQVLQTVTNREPAGEPVRGEKSKTAETVHAYRNWGINE